MLYVDPGANPLVVVPVVQDIAWSGKGLSACNEALNALQRSGAGVEGHVPQFMPVPCTRVRNRTTFELAVGDTVVSVGDEVGLGVCPATVGEVEGERDGAVGAGVGFMVVVMVGLVVVYVGLWVGALEEIPQTSTMSEQQSFR